MGNKFRLIKAFNDEVKCKQESQTAHVEQTDTLLAPNDLPAF